MVESYRPMPLNMRSITSIVIIMCCVKAGSGKKESQIPDDGRVNYDTRVVSNELVRGVKYEEQESSGSPVLAIYCYSGRNRSLSDVFKTASIHLQVRGGGSDYEVFRANNASEVRAEYERRHAWLWLTLVPHYRPTEMLVPLYSASCIGVHTSHPYTIHLTIRDPDIYRVALFLAAIILFLLAPVLCRNMLFYYTSGLAIGILGSLLILVFVVSKLVPGRRLGAYALLLGGWSLSAYLLQYVFLHMQDVCSEYSEYVIGYLAVVSALTLCVLYWRGPLSDYRTLNLIQWGLQLVAALLVYVSVQVEEVSVACVVALVMVRVVPVAGCVGRWWRRRFPRRHRLLTDDEYLSQARLETERALRGLRDYCRSPECNAWSVMSRVREPRRLAGFIVGDSGHVWEEDVSRHETDPGACQLPWAGDTDSDGSSSSPQATLTSTPTRALGLLSAGTLAHRPTTASTSTATGSHSIQPRRKNTTTTTPITTTITL